MWNDIETRLAGKIADRLNELKLFRAHKRRGCTVLLDEQEISSSLDGFCAPFYPGAILARRIMSILGFDEKRILSYRLEHKLVQSLLLDHYAPGVVPTTFGAFRVLNGLSDEQSLIVTEDLYKQGYFLKNALGEASGEASTVDRRVDFSKVRKARQERFEQNDLTSESFIFQEFWPVAAEFRVHSMEDRVIPRLTFFRFLPKIPNQALTEKLEAFVQDILDQLPNALICDSLFAWDIAMDEKGRFKVIETNIGGMHKVFRPGFHCSGFFQVPTWSIPCTARLCAFVCERYDLTLRFSVGKDIPGDLGKMLALIPKYLAHLSIIEVARAAIDSESVKQDVNIDGLVSGLSADFNCVAWMAAESESLMSSSSLQSEQNHLSVRPQRTGTLSRFTGDTDSPATAISIQPRNVRLDTMSDRFPYTVANRYTCIPIKKAEPNGPTRRSASYNYDFDPLDEHWGADDVEDGCFPNGWHSGDLIDDVIAARTRVSPDACAIIYDNKKLSYSQLDFIVRDLAATLRVNGIRPGILVGVCLERDPHIIPTILAVMRAGGAYIPIDPLLPADRIRYMIEDSKAILVVTTSKYTDLLIGCGFKGLIVNVDENLGQHSVDIDLREGHEQGTVSGLAYVIYTSGSTGLPKGVMVEHRSLSNHIFGMQKVFGLRSSDVVLFKTPYSFDVSVWEIFWPLCVGATIVVAEPQGHRSPSYLTQIIQKYGVTTVQFVPTMLREFLRYGDASNCTSLMRVLVIGEPLPSILIKQFQSLLPSAELSNLYGPTETTVAVTVWRCPPNYDVSSVPIGKPMHGVNAHILNSRQGAVEDGHVGEIYISGIQVARGYLNRIEDAAKKFVVNHSISMDRMYSTGDRGRLLSDGNLEYLGRIDDQLKIQGNRVEPAEIELKLSSFPGVREVVVKGCYDTDETLRLVAYLSLTSQEKQPLERDLRIFLRVALPESFVPSRFVFIESFPLMSNGKLDRGALVSPYKVVNRPSITSAEKVEDHVAELVCGALGVPKPERTISLLALGADSIGIIRLANRMSSIFDIDISIPWLFSDEASVVAIAELIEGAAEDMGEDA